MSNKSKKCGAWSKVFAVVGILVAAGVTKVCAEKVKEKVEHNERVRKEKAIGGKDCHDYFVDDDKDDKDGSYGDENDLYDEDDEDDDDEDGIFFSKVVSEPWVSLPQKIRDEAEDAVTAYTTFGKHFFDEYKNCEVIALGASALTEAKSRYSAEEWRDLRYALKEIACEEYEDELNEKDEHGESIEKADSEEAAVKATADKTLSELRRAASDSLSSLVSGSSVYSTLQNIFGDGDKTIEFEFEDDNDEDDANGEDFDSTIDEDDEYVSDDFLDDLEDEMYDTSSGASQTADDSTEFEKE